MAKYPYFGIPPPREHRPAVDEPALTGKRVILSTPEGFVYDMRAAGEIYTDGQGGAVIGILSERDYFRRILTSDPCHPAPWPIHLVWVD